MGYLPTGVLPTGNLPTGPVCTTGCGRGRSAATAVPTKARDALPMITYFNIVVSRRTLAPSTLTTNPNHYREAISRAQTSDRTLSFFDGCCRNSTHFRGVGAASLRGAAALEIYFKPASEEQWENPAGPRHVGAITVAEGFQHHLLFSGNAAEKQGPKTNQARAAGNPVRQQQCLCDSPQPKR